MVAEVEAKKLKGPQKEFENLLNEDFKDRKLKDALIEQRKSGAGYSGSEDYNQ